VEYAQVLTVVLTESPTNASRFETWWVDTDKGTTVSILWQAPQYVLSSVGEVLFSVTGFEFVFSESPDSLKVMIYPSFPSPGASSC
jgi:dipeptide/tripeptide permease